MDKRILSIVGTIGCLGFIALTVISTFFLAKFIHWLPALAICAMFYTAVFFFFFNALYNRGIEIRTATLYEDSESNFNDIEVDSQSDIYEAPDKEKK